MIICVQSIIMFISSIFTAANGIACMDQEALKKLNKNKKLVKKLAKKYNAFMASDTLIKQVGVAGRGRSTGRGGSMGRSLATEIVFNLNAHLFDVPSVCRFPVFWDPD